MNGTAEQKIERIKQLLQSIETEIHECRKILKGETS